MIKQKSVCVNFIGGIICNFFVNNAKFSNKDGVFTLKCGKTCFQMPIIYNKKEEKRQNPRCEKSSKNF